MTGHALDLMATRDEIPTSIGDAIRAARDAMGWTQAHLARLLEVEAKNINNWESGRHRPSLSMYSRMAMLFRGLPGWDLPYSFDPDTGSILGHHDWPMLEESLDVAHA